MARQWPQVVYKEEGMREGMQIEDSNIAVEDKVRLLDALSETGLKTIVVGSFVSPKWTPPDDPHRRGRLQVPPQARREVHRPSGQCPRRGAGTGVLASSDH